MTTIATIARALDVSIERLYYGDDNNAFINTVSDDGRKIVNSIYLLWNLGVISYFENYSYDMYECSENVKPKGVYLYIREYETQIKRFINSLNEFEKIKKTYQEPDKYLEMLKDSIANEINHEIKEKKELEERRQKELEVNRARFVGEGGMFTAPMHLN